MVKHTASTHIPLSPSEKIKWIILVFLQGHQISRTSNQRVAYHDPVTRQPWPNGCSLNPHLSPFKWLEAKKSLGFLVRETKFFVVDLKEGQKDMYGALRQFAHDFKPGLNPLLWLLHQLFAKTFCSSFLG